MNKITYFVLLILITLHASATKIPVKSETLTSELSSDLENEDLLQYNSSKTIETSQTRPLHPDQVVAIKDPVFKKKSQRIATVEDKSSSKKKNDLLAVKSLNNNEPEKKQTDDNNLNSTDTNQSPQPATPPKGNQINNQPPRFTASHQDNYNIEITAVTTNIYKELTPDLPVLSIGRSGDKLNVTAEDSLWYCVNLNGTPGFLSKGNARKLTQTDSIPKLTGSIIIGIVSLIAVLLIVYILLKLKKIKHNTIDRISCLLITNKKAYKIFKYK
jgi:hypothetical protein